MDNSDLIGSCLTFYDSIKPKRTSNSYTVLSAVYSYSTNRLLALATGTQACLRSSPDQIEDCHAESLVRRAYKRYLIDKVAFIQDSSTLDEVRKELKCEQDLTLFITSFPCGLIRRFHGDEPVDESTGQVIKRKPGRGTEIGNKIVYVEKDYCIAKLEKWISVGFQGKRIQQILGMNFRLKKILIGNNEPDEDMDCSVYVNDMKSRFKSQDIDIELVDSVRRDEFVFSPDKQRQPVSLAWWAQALISSGTKSKNIEFVVDGLRNGLTKRQRLANGTSSRLKIANQCLNSDLDNIEKALIPIDQNHVPDRLDKI